MKKRFIDLLRQLILLVFYVFMWSSAWAQQAGDQQIQESKKARTSEADKTDQINPLLAPACIHDPEKNVCKLDSKALQAREQEIITKQWELVRAVIPELKTAVLVRPFSKVKPEDDAPYINYCESLRTDLIKGKYNVLRKPDTASSQVGIGKLAEAFAEVEQDCELKIYSSNLLKNKRVGYEGGRWLYKLNDGFAVLTFDLPTATYKFNFEFNACNKRHSLPVWSRKGHSKRKNRTDVFGMAVIERGERALVGLEYLEVHGGGDWSNCQADEYGCVLGTFVEDTPRQPKEPIVLKIGQMPEPLPPPRPARVLGAFIAPPPWDKYDPEVAELAEGFPQHYEPCVWKFNDK